MRDAAAGARSGFLEATPSVYRQGPASNLRGRENFGGLAYTDGGETERRLYEVVRTVRDRGTFSRELAQAIDGWPAEYHLGRERHCIVRPLGIEAGDKVLELGCGCGAITRYLGEIGAKVVSVEGSWQRAHIAAERCRDLPNVEVFVDDLTQFVTEERFDWVLLVGVLEYAAVFSEAPDAAAQTLCAAANFLKSEGRLVVAIENKLGLKYFNGCGEDHVGVPFHGVQGLYGERSAQTFGRAELGALVREAGLPHVEFLYPFPDYKLPRVVLREAALHDDAFDAACALSYVRARDYRGNPNRLFDEALVCAEAARNGLLGELSNSFLVVAGRQPPTPDNVLAMAFSVHRHAEFTTQTRFVRDGDAVKVCKTRLAPSVMRPRVFADGSVLQHVAGENDYIAGPLAFRALTLARARRGDLGAIVSALLPWFDFLLAHARPAAGPYLRDLTLPGRYLDVTPFNVVETPHGLAPIDMEWQVDRDISLGWVVTRALIHSLWGIAGFERSPVAIADVVGALAEQRGFVASAGDITNWVARENEFQLLSTGRTLPDFSDGLESRQIVPAQHVTEQETRIVELTQTASALQSQLDLMRGSRSWRYSYPLRAAGRLIRDWKSPHPQGAPAADAPAPQFPRAGSGLMAWFGHDAMRYAVTTAAVLAAFALNYLMIANGIRLPRMLLYLAMVTVVARVGGLGPGLLALIGSVLAIVLSVPVAGQTGFDLAFGERLGVFLLCAIVGVAVSVQRQAERERH